MAGPTILSLFSGVGGLEVAVKLALPGSCVVGYVERDSFACAALMARMEESSMDLAPVFVGRIQDMDGRELRGHVDVVCGGIPCRPYSIAGARLGNRDERALWHELARIVEECQPSLVFIENVPTFVTGAGFRPLGEELCRLGYEIADPLFIGAGDVGAPHGRRRVFILAYRDLERREVERRLQELDEGVRSPQRDDADGRDEGLADATDDNGGSGEPGAEAGTREDRERGRGSPGGGGGIRKESVPDAERDVLRNEPGGSSGESGAGEAITGELGFFPPGPGNEQEWARIIKGYPGLAPAIEPGLRVVVDGVPVVLDESRADQLRCAGNSVVVAQAYVAFRQLLRWIERGNE